MKMQAGVLFARENILAVLADKYAKNVNI